MAGAVIGEGNFVCPCDQMLTIVAVRIGKNSLIGPNVVLENCDIGDNVVIKPGACIGQVCLSDFFFLMPENETLIQIGWLWLDSNA